MPGKKYGLFLLLDPKPYQLKSREVTRKANYSFKVAVHSLAQYSTFGAGSYGMSALKKMTGTESFEQLPDHQKKCRVHNREECQTQKYLDQVEKECKCVPWNLESLMKKDQVKILFHYFVQFARLLYFACLGDAFLWTRKARLCQQPTHGRHRLPCSL